MRRSVILNWEPSSFHGWGVYGLNLALALANDADLEPVSTYPGEQNKIALDPIRLRTLEPFFRQSHALAAQLAPMTDRAVQIDAPLLTPLDSELTSSPSFSGVPILGAPTIGVTFFETARLTAAAVAEAANYPLIVTGSTWNERVLRAHGLHNVKTILQGVDPLLFHPAPPAARSDGRFRVFSGGKLEPRKGQDIALAAFHKFAARRPDAQLVAAWHSPWPALARSIDTSGLVAPVTFGADGRLDASAWALANGLRPDQFIDAGQTPNAMVPQLLRQIDVALLPNRCEGGTNLVAMECMACGVPTILSANTGHLDLIEDDNCFVLSHQGEVKGNPKASAFGEIPGWGESDVDEAVDRLEQAYADRQATRRRGERGAATLAKLTWAQTAASLKVALLQANRPSRRSSPQ